MPITPPSGRSAARATTPPRRATIPCAVLIDGSALFLGARTLYEGRQLDYRALVRLLVERCEGVTAPALSGGHSRWVMWTSAAPQNQGQARFLDFAENELHWEIRAFAPADSFMVEPVAVLGLSAESKSAGRLVRFDASIAFALGRLAETHRLVVVTDSFAISDPLLRAAQLAPEGAPRPVLASFGRALDGRWLRVLRNQSEAAPVLLDLDDFESGLFGAGAERPKPTTTLRGHDLLF